jgi:hypothetical protein
MEELMAEVQGVRGSAVSDARELAKEMVAMSQRPQGEDGGKVAERLTEKASESVLGNIEGQQVAVRFFEFIDAVEEMKAEIASDAVVLVPLEDWWTEVGLPCHAYYWMPQNGKRMLFVRPGGKLRLESLDRFQNSGVPTLAVDPTDFEAFRKMRNLVQSLGYQPRQGAAKYLTPAA